MPNQQDAQASCFSGLGLKKVFGRKRQTTPEQPLSSEEETKPQPTSSSHHREWSFYPAEPLPAYSPGSGAPREKLTTTLTPEIISTIESKLDSLDAELRELSLKIHSHPELAFKEFYAHETLTAFMESHNFTVTRHYTLPTAWRAEYTSSPASNLTNVPIPKRIPVLGINSEMDALPGIGHGCGHNLIAICGVGVALAVAHALEKHGIAGKVVLLGTPAEEAGGGKAIMLKKDLYKEMDVCLMAHPMPGPSNSAALMSSNAMEEVTVEYFGKTAHAGASPWEGKNALDAAVIAYAAISALRQQFKPTVRVHGIIEGKDWVANVIPDYSKLTYIVRAPTMAEVIETLDRVKGCFNAAASATGCEVTVKKDFAYFDLRQNPVLGEEFSAQAKSRYNMDTIPLGTMGASTDFGNVSYGILPPLPSLAHALNPSAELPSLHPGFAIPTVPNGGNHTIGFTDSSKTPEAHSATMTVTKGLALTGFRALADDKFLQAVKDSFEEEMSLRQTVYTRT